METKTMRMTVITMKAMATTKTARVTDNAILE